jgi:hypothetical protein
MGRVCLALAKLKQRVSAGWAMRCFGGSQHLSRSKLVAVALMTMRIWETLAQIGGNHAVERRADFDHAYG